MPRIRLKKSILVFLCVYSWNSPKRTTVSAFKSFLTSHFVVTPSHLRASFPRLLLCADLLLSQLPSPAVFYFLLCLSFFFEVWICPHHCHKVLGKAGAAGFYCGMKRQLMKQAVKQKQQLVWLHSWKSALHPAMQLCNIAWCSLAESCSSLCLLRLEWFGPKFWLVQAWEVMDYGCVLPRHK